MALVKEEGSGKVENDYNKKMCDSARSVNHLLKSVCIFMIILSREQWISSSLARFRGL